jgi:membrane protein implicated in regulation of membrane protease activity
MLLTLLSAAVALIIGVAWFALVRPRMVKRLGPGKLPSRTERLVGQTALVTQAINPVLGTGRILVTGEDWAAKSEDPVDQGAKVIVHGADGIVLIVSPLE